MDKIILPYWDEHKEWLEGLSEEDSAKYWLHCYATGHSRGLLPSIPELERDTGENFDVGFWNEKGKQLFIAADKAYELKNPYCLYCQVLGDVKTALEKEFEQEKRFVEAL